LMRDDFARNLIEFNCPLLKVNSCGYKTEIKKYKNTKIYCAD